MPTVSSYIGGDSFIEVSDLRVPSKIATTTSSSTTQSSSVTFSSSATTTVRFSVEEISKTLGSHRILHQQSSSTAAAAPTSQAAYQCPMTVSLSLFPLAKRPPSERHADRRLQQDGASRDLCGQDSAQSQVITCIYGDTDSCLNTCVYNAIVS